MKKENFAEQDCLEEFSDVRYMVHDEVEEDDIIDFRLASSKNPSFDPFSNQPLPPPPPSRDHAPIKLPTRGDRHELRYASVGKITEI